MSKKKKRYSNSVNSALLQKSIRKCWPIFLLPLMIAFAIGFIYPFFSGMYLSFCKFTTTSDAKLVGFVNYKEAFKDKTFTHAFWYTALFAIVSLVIINVVAFAIAYVLTQGIRGTNIFRTVFFMPNLIGGMVLGYIWNMMEAAKIDGAGRMQTLFKVTIPNVMPSITICTFLTLTNGFKLFDQNLALTGGQPYEFKPDGTIVKTTEMLALNIYNTFYGQNTSARGVAQAKAVLFFVLVAAISIIQLRMTKSKEVQQ